MTDLSTHDQTSFESANPDPTLLITAETGLAPAFWPPRTWPLCSREALWAALGLVLLLEVVKDLAKVISPAETLGKFLSH